ncbi:MAG: hypothetical protein L3J33_12840 [Rhodobacteraceae bacterium]|nr:hypothetical protein [Paracoccaceae bacterium]
MSELQVEGMALKKLIKIAKKTPLPFGFNPSTKIPECYLAMHRKKPANIIGKDAKDEGPGEKSAYGMLEVKGKLLIINCQREVPNLAKIFKKYLKLQKVMLNVEVRDHNGKVLESDVEEGLPDDPELEGEDGADAGLDKAALAKRLAGLKTRLQALGKDDVKKFAGPFAKVVSLFKQDELEKCARGADRIETALPKTTADPLLAKLVELYRKFATQTKTVPDASKRGNIEKALAQAATHLKAKKTAEAKDLLTKIQKALQNATGDGIPKAPPLPDPKAIKLLGVLNNYRNQLGRVANETLRAKLATELDQTAKLLKAGDLDQTTTRLVKIREALSKALAAAKLTEQQAAEENRQKGLTEAPKETGQDAKDFENWNAVHKELSDQINTALSKGLVADVDGLRKNWNWAVATAADKKYTEALKPIPEIRKMLAAGTADGKSVFNEAIPADVKPFAESRIRWSFARSKMNSELDKLKASILDSVKDDKDLSIQVSDNMGELTKHLAGFDDRLEDKLDQIVNESDVPKRNTYKIDAKKLLAEYRTALEDDFFQEVDKDSGFGTVSITATAQTALKAIETVLT